MAKIQREGYIAAREKLSALTGQVHKLSDRLWNELIAAEDAACAPLRKQLLDAREAAVEKYRAAHEAEYAQLKELIAARGEAARAFNQLEFDCNHVDENGQSAIQSQWTLGMEKGDKPRVKCSICAETWE